MDGRPTIVALALGSNLGDRRGNLHAALAALPPSVSILRLASLFESEAVSDISQPDFLNSALLGSTRLDPEGLLAVLKSIELRIGRRAGHRWGPRPLDLDLLLYGDRLEHRPELTIPHPRLTRRRFVLDPLAEIAPDLGVPPDLLTVAEGIETTAQLHELRSIGCDLGQGYLLSQPLEADELVRKFGPIEAIGIV